MNPERAAAYIVKQDTKMRKAIRPEERYSFRVGKLTLSKVIYETSGAS